MDFNLIAFILELIGAGAFAISGALVGVSKNIYATASIAGALLLCILYPFTHQYIAMMSAAGLIILIRIMAFAFDRNIPKPGRG